LECVTKYLLTSLHNERFSNFYFLQKQGDLSKEIAKRTKVGVANFTGKENYQFGDITKTAFKNYTGKDEYEFGDVTKKLMGNLFSNKKKGGK